MSKRFYMLAVTPFENISALHAYVNITFLSRELL